MDISLSKLPWYAQIGAFVVVSGLAVFGFWKFYVAEMQADIDTRQTRLTALKRTSRKVSPPLDGCPSSSQKSPNSNGVSKTCAPCCRSRKTSLTSCAVYKASRRSRA